MNPPDSNRSKPCAEFRPEKIFLDAHAGNRSVPAFLSLIVHAAGICLILMFSFWKPAKSLPVTTVHIVKDISLYLPKAAAGKSGGGGGGGDRSPLPPRNGKLPKTAKRQFVPPLVTTKPEPKLAMDPAIIAPPEIIVPAADSTALLGDPLASVSAPSAGPGSGGGIGTGSGGGVGSGNGQGIGAGKGGGAGGGAYRLQSSMTPPVLISQVKPEYTAEAQRAKLEGSVELLIEIDEQGNVRSARVTKPLGMGLDETSIEAVKQWKFKPALKNGKPVAVAAPVSCRFRLL